MSKKLEWKWNGDGCWVAVSNTEGRGQHRIKVDEYGRFFSSSLDLPIRFSTFHGLEQAKKFCQDWEDRMDEDKKKQQAQSNATPIPPTDIPGEIFSALVHDAILDYYLPSVLPDTFEDGLYDVIEWMHNPNNIFTIKINQTTGQIYWSAISGGHATTGIGWPSNEAWRLIRDITRLGLVKKDRKEGQ